MNSFSNNRKPFKKFGGSKGGFGGGSRPSRGGSNRDGQTFKTVCAQCDRQCEVPFRPNGRKPVLCSYCFKKDGDRSGNDFQDRNERQDRPTRPQARPEGKPAFGGGDSAGIKEQLAVINAKLDDIMGAIEAMSD